jgi:NAD(P)-dependent dehydrogenase (short-subunit alcohol dehydrogenase family)
VRVNLIGSFNCLRLAAAMMAKQEPLDDQGQRGVVGMTLPIARDLSALGIRVNTVAPGLFDTPIYGEGEGSEAFKAKLGQSVLFPKRLGHADELASMVMELLTNDYNNGEVVRADGGVRLPPK